jgi:hypothetical protein
MQLYNYSCFVKFRDTHRDQWRTPCEHDTQPSRTINTLGPFLDLLSDHYIPNENSALRNEWVTEKRIQFTLTPNILYLKVLHMLIQHMVAILSDNFRLPLTACSLILLTQPIHLTTQTHGSVAEGRDNPPTPSYQDATINYVSVILSA